MVSHDGEILAEVVYAVKNELAQSLRDVLFHRTGIGTLGYPGDEVFIKVVNLVRELLNWDEKRTADEIDAVMKIFKLPAD